MIIILFLLGACFGSFYLVIGTRLPNNQDVIKDRSKCDHCNHVLQWYELVPILSYICLLGKCHHCNKRISMLNPLVEVVMGLVFVFSYLYYGFSYEFFMFLIISSLLVLIFITDFLYYIILDSPLVVSSILVVILKFIYLTPKDVGISILSGLGLFLTMLAIKFIGDFAFKKESLGGGDIKFAFVIGLCLGFRLGIVALILSTFLALPYSFASIFLQKNNEVAYGPFLAASLFIVFLFMDKFLNLLNAIAISL